MGDTTPILDAPFTFIAGFLAPEVADTTLAALLAGLPWERRISRIYGKDVRVPRMEVWSRIAPTRKPEQLGLLELKLRACQKDAHPPS